MPSTDPLLTPISSNFIGSLPDEFSIDDVGSRLLEDLAQGLYQADEVVREYVQNAVDAHRLWQERTGFMPPGPIQIEVRGDTLTIIDYGIGMDFDEISKVKSIAVSKKREAIIPLTGYKGVGIWAGLSFFEVLDLRTTRRGSSRMYRLVIRFNEIVRSIGDDASIGDVLNPNYFIQEYEEREDQHYTEVHLMRPTRNPDFFQNAKNIEAAVKRICPCEIDPGYIFRNKLLDWYRENDIDMFPIHVQGKPVFRTYPNTVEDFKTGTITIEDEEFGVYWYAIHERNAAMQPRGNEIVGFRVIQNGFALGDINLYGERNRANFDTLKVATYLDWHVGEIHVTSPELRPNLERREFEESYASRQFVTKLRDWYQGIADQARIISDTRNLLSSYHDKEEKIESLVAKASSEGLDQNDLETLNDIEHALQEDDDTVAEHYRRRTRNVSSKVAALRSRESSQTRRRLLTQISDLREGPVFDSHLDEGIFTTEIGESYSVSGVSTHNSEPDNAPLEQVDHGLSQQTDVVFDLNEDTDSESTSIAEETNSGEYFDDEDDALTTDSPLFADNGELFAQISVAVDTVYGLLEEILEEMLVGNPNMSVAILDKLQERVNRVLFDER
jgi:hypothetical protein